MVSPHVSNVFLSVTYRTFGNGRCFVFIFDICSKENMLVSMNVDQIAGSIIELHYTYSHAGVSTLAFRPTLRYELC